VFLLDLLWKVTPEIASKKRGFPRFLRRKKCVVKLSALPLLAGRVMIFLIYVMATAVKRILLSVSSILKP
jgi:hypothetical protein